MPTLQQLLLSFLMLFVGFTHAQSNCDSQRYIDDLFTVQITNEPADFATVDALIYPPYVSEFFTFSRDLSFDFYEPQGDVLTKRPLIIMAFGGAFLLGSKQQSELEDFCEALARKGFCVASIDYRLGFNIISGNSATRAVYRGLQDFKAAVRYFRQNAALYNIDPDHIFGGGNSAGSINALHAAYVDDADRTPTSLFAPTFNNPDLDCPNCSGNTLTVSSKTNGTVNLWGAIGEVSWIQNTEAPIISFHGTADNIVSPNTNAPFGASALFPDLNGSIPIHAQADAIGLLNELHLFQGEGHELWTDNANALFIQEESADFLYQLMKPELPTIAGNSAACAGSIFSYSVNNPTVDSEFCWSLSNGTIINDNGSSIDVIWNTPSSVGMVEVIENNCLDIVSNPTSITVNIVPNTTPTFTPIGPLCQFDNPIILQSISDNGIIGSWSPSSTVMTTNAGSFSFTFTPDVGQCADPVTTIININPLASPTFDPIGPLCQYYFPPNLPAVSNEGITGTWIPGVIGTSVPGITTYTFTPNGGQCAETATIDVIVEAPIIPTFDPVGPICEFDIAPTLPIISNNAITGTWVPFNLPNSPPSTTTFTFTPNQDCAQTATIDFTVNPLPNANFTIQSPQCTSDGIAFPIGNLDPGGIWSISNGGVIDASSGIIDLAASGPGFFIITYDVQFGACSNSHSEVLEIVDCGCPASTIFTNNIPNGTLEQVTNFIQTLGNVKVLNGSTVILEAGDYIEFNSGFEVQLGSELDAIIEDCQ